jgi:hypothetical protein
MQDHGVDMGVLAVGAACVALWALTAQRLPVGTSARRWRWWHSVFWSPTSRSIFSTSSGSGDTLKVSSRHGLSPNARQIWRTVVWEIPCLAASARVDQWVASGARSPNKAPVPPHATDTRQRLWRHAIRELLARLLPHRRTRANPRVVKRKVHPLARQTRFTPPPLAATPRSTPTHSPDDLTERYCC